MPWVRARLRWSLSRKSEWALSMIGNYFCKKKNKKNKIKNTLAASPKKIIFRKVDNQAGTCTSSKKGLSWRNWWLHRKQWESTADVMFASLPLRHRLVWNSTWVKKIAIQYANNSNFFTQAHKDEIILLWIEQTITVIEIR